MDNPTFVPPFPIDDDADCDANNPTFVPPFVIDDDDEPVPVIELDDDVAEEKPVVTCSHPLPPGYFDDIIVRDRQQSFRIIPPTNDPLPLERRNEALEGTALIRATDTECFPSGFCHEWTAWALARDGKLVAWDAWWADKCSATIGALFGRARGSIDIAVYLDPTIRQPAT